jgi:xylulose-5-phosphate/fructose-6-phosphate phosphoketolase
MTMAIEQQALTDDQVATLDLYWRAANYLSAGQIYLMDNPLLTEPLRAEHIKPRLAGHWGTAPGLNFVRAHLNRLISGMGQEMLCVIGPGDGGAAALATTWLEGSYTEIYPGVTRDAAGMRELFRQFSFHESGELGYSLSHAFGAAFDNPDLIVACVIGDGEAETGPLAASWPGHRFLNPVADGAVLPILHLNGWQVASPAVLARIPDDDLEALLRGYGYEPEFVTGGDPVSMHGKMAAALNGAVRRIRLIQRAARNGGPASVSARWPMIVLRTPEGWTGPKVVDGLRVDATWRAHQVPLAEVRTNPAHLRQLEEWLRSYRPEELFDTEGRPRPELLELVPSGAARLGSSPHGNGGLLLRDLRLPDFRDYAVTVKAPGADVSEPTRVLGGYLRDVMAANEQEKNFRAFGPGETGSNGAGWLEGYLRTGRHGLLTGDETLLPRDDGMLNQHAKWLTVSRQLAWRRPVASLNYLLTSAGWPDPGFIDHVVSKKAEVVRVYLPPDANTLLSVADHCLRSRDHVNVIVAGQQPSADWLDMDAAALHCARGAGIWEWASTDTDGAGPDVVLGCAGDVPTLEILAAASILREHLPELRVRVVNVVDLMRMQPDTEHPHGMSEAEFDALFTPGTPVIFAYHGYPWLIHRLTGRRGGHENLHVRGYQEEGSATTPFDLVVMNDLDRYHLVMDVIDRVPGLDARAAQLRQLMVDSRARHHAWIREHGEDLPEVTNWAWPDASSAARTPGC